MTIRCSVVVPSCNRAERLAALLEGLASQTVDLREIEIVVVLDRAPEESLVVLRDWSSQLPNLRWLHAPRTGRAAARNAGVDVATGDIVVFFDDDVVPAPDAIALHLAHHESGHPLAVVGECPLQRPERPKRYELHLWAWWEDFNGARRGAAACRSHRDFCTGNASVRRADVVAVGGFDERFVGHGGEDWELGQRLLESGVELVVEPRARAAHHSEHTLLGMMRRSFEEAGGHVTLATLHPHLVATLPLAEPLPPAAKESFERRAIALIKLVALVGATAVWPRSSEQWLRFYRRARRRAYWYGVARHLDTFDALEGMRRAAPEPDVVCVPIAGSLPHELGRNDRTRRIEIRDGSRTIAAVDLPPFDQIGRDRTAVARALAARLDDAVLSAFLDLEHR